MDSQSHDHPVLLVSRIIHSVLYQCPPSREYFSLDFSSSCSCDEIRNHIADGDLQALLPRLGGYYELRIICTSYHKASLVWDEIKEKMAERRLVDITSDSASIELLGRLSLMCECDLVRQHANKRLAKKIRAPLRDGFVSGSAQMGYVYIVSGNSRKDHFKIGYSKNHPKSRVARHRKCYKGAKLIAYTSMIRHAHRVEQLVHWELDNLRRTAECATCKHEHKEWFDISKEVAIQVVSRWARWICSQPYDPQTGKLKMFWARRAHLGHTSDLRSVTGPAFDARTWKDWSESWKADNHYRKELEHPEKFKIHWCSSEDRTDIRERSESEVPMGQLEE